MSNPVQFNSNTHWVTTTTAPRVTPSEGPTFREVLDKGAQTLVSGATAAVRSLPVGPMIAPSVRPMPPSAVGSPALEPSGSLAPSGSLTQPQTAEGPGAGGTSAGTPDQPSIESALKRSEEMNMYMLELQARVAEQNRAFTTYSNVLKARHDTLKNAINNIR